MNENITVEYNDCKFDITVTDYFVQKPCWSADNPSDYYGYSEIDFTVNTITSIAYDEDGNALSEVTIPYDLTDCTEREFLEKLWNDHGIDLEIDWDELSDVVETEFKRC